MLLGFVGEDFTPLKGNFRQVSSSKIFTQMDPVELKKVRRAAKRLQESGIQSEVIINQYARLSSNEGELKASALGPSPTSFSKG